MKTILSISACWFLFVFMHVEAVTDGEFQSLLTRFSVLEEKQVLLETENKLSQKRIADLEKYKTLSDRRIASLERKNAFCNRRQDALDIVKRLYADKVALETGKILPDTATTTNGNDKTLSDMKPASIVKAKIVPDGKISTLEDDYAVSPNRRGKADGYSAAVDIEDRPTAVLQSKHRRIVAEGIVAFSAMKVSAQDHVGVNQNILFEQAVTNEGGGYHPNHGVFIAPQSGVYVFSSSIMCNANGEVLADMVHNGNLVARIYCHGDGGKGDQGSQTVVITMSAGDEVAVRNIQNVDNLIWGNLFSSFSGYLVWLK